MTSAAVAFLVVVGAALVLIACIGLVRLPDLYTRMHASTKPATLGVSLLVAGLALHAGDLGIGVRAVLVVLFFLVTAPVAAQRLAHAAYRTGVPRCAATVRDDLADEPGAAPPPRVRDRQPNFASDE